MNISAIGSAIADRFSAAAITPPSGYADIATSTHLLPNAITSLPTVLVFPPSGSWTYGPGQRVGDLSFPVRFYVDALADRPRATAALNAWYGVLIDQIEPNYDLDQSGSGHVTHATIESSTAGTLTYADHDYAGIEYVVSVHIVQGIAPAT